jgi:hypothetical protein
MPITCDIGELYPRALKAAFPTGQILETPKRSRIEMSRNLVDGLGLAFYSSCDIKKLSKNPEELLQQQLDWKGSHNLFPPMTSLCFRNATDTLTNTNLTAGLADWRRFWDDPETGSVEGWSPRYIGGDVRRRAKEAPEQLTPTDFRLHPDSPGHGAGPDGKDLGADVDLVGPGPAYERWKKTPDYQQWLTDTGQTK